MSKRLIIIHFNYSIRKAERENRKAELGPVHKRLIDLIAEYVMECDPQIVEDFILDSEKQMSMISSFIKKGIVEYYFFKHS